MMQLQVDQMTHQTGDRPDPETQTEGKLPFWPILVLKMRNNGVSESQKAQASNDTASGGSNDSYKLNSEAPKEGNSPF